jgi:hypothetical protein
MLSSWMRKRGALKFKINVQLTSPIRCGIRRCRSTSLAATASGGSHDRTKGNLTALTSRARAKGVLTRTKDAAIAGMNAAANQRAA